MKDKDNPVWFPGWMACLEGSGFPPGQISSMASVIRWYLSFCKRGRVRVTFASARDFLESGRREKNPSQELEERWKEAIRWFFRAAKGHSSAVRGQKSEVGGHSPSSGGLRHDKGAEAEWSVKMRTVLRVRHYSYRTEQSYLSWGARFAAHVGAQKVSEAGEDQIKGFLEALARDHRISASTQRQALNAVVFLMREVYGKTLGDFSDYKKARVRQRLPTVLTRQEVNMVLEQLEGTSLIMVKTMYGSGLRLMELLRLRIKDVDLERGCVIVRFGKGGKDRVAPLGQQLVSVLGEHLKRLRGLYEEDRRQGVAGVHLPDALARKYPKAGEEWPWFWLWPARGLSVDPRHGVKRRHHVMERSFQVMVKEAARRAGLNKRVTPHVLRHSFATNLLEQGTDIRTVQELMGHESVETTQIYLHVMQKPGLGIKSPLDG